MELSQVIKNIANAMESLDGEEIARIHNDICLEQISYTGDSQWESLDEIEQIRRDEKNGLYLEKTDIAN